VATRVLIVDHSKIVRQGVRSELAATGACVVAEATNGADAIAAAARHRPDVVLLDSKLPDRSCSDVCAAILGRHPGTAVIVLSASGESASVRGALDAGAQGYIAKDADDLDLPRAIERVLAGENVIDSRSAAAVLGAGGRVDDPRLTGQELNVLRLVAEGLTNPEIGGRLFLSRHTVKEYVSNAMRKLDATNRIEAVRKATALGLIDGMGVSPFGAPTPRRDTLVYNESGAPTRSSEIKVTPLKIDKLSAAGDPEG
jgi:DNA-binding NarL/FixJ family response regulator